MIRKLLYTLTGLLLTASLAFAVTTPNSFISPQTINRGILQFTNSSSAGTYSTLYTSGLNGSRCYGLYATSSDATNHALTVQFVTGGTRYGGMTINTGTTLPGFANAVPPLNLLSTGNWPGLPVDEKGNPFIQLVTPDTIQATFTTAITSSTFVNLVAFCSDF